NDALDQFHNLMATLVANYTFVLEPVARRSNVWEATRRLEVTRQRDAAAFRAQLEAQGPPGTSIANADLVAKGAQELLAACCSDLARRIEAVKPHMVAQLTFGVAHGILGVVAWPGSDSCWYARSERRYVLKQESERRIDARRVEREQVWEYFHVL